MCELGNTVINRIYEARIDEITIKKPHPSSPRYKQSTLTNVHTLKGHYMDKVQLSNCCVMSHVALKELSVITKNDPGHQGYLGLF